MNEWDWIDLLARRVNPLAGAASGVRTAIGDDAAVLEHGDGKLLVTTDAFVENVHFTPRWAAWPRIGRKMAEASVSDVCAMGGEAFAMVVALSAASAGAEEAARGLLEGFLASGIPLVGGDTTGAAPGSLTVTVTVLGRARRPVLRSGARPGERVWLSGPVGGALAGLRSLEQALDLASCEERFLDARARRDLAVAWGERAGAMIDVSDGLAAECHHLAASSGARIVLDASAIPIAPGIAAAGDPLSLAMGSGEEFELLATSALDLPGGVVIGRVEEGTGVYFADGRAVERAGWTHWS